MEALPPGAHTWSEAERELADAVLSGETIVVNVRKGGPHRRLVPWLVEAGLLTYVGRAGRRHAWPASDFGNPFVGLRGNRPEMVRRYREWLPGREALMRRLRAGELAGRALGCWCAPEGCHADVLAELSVSARTLDPGGRRPRDDR
ncbi:DUF4326 domain-containing protein [Actinophytocola sp.]|uniref:DUF4326 domain-containing protein n=1 Tax=Actinophytocola sp. TaxID=1872138 RepID=UPI002ED92AFA